MSEIVSAKNRCLFWACLPNGYVIPGLYLQQKDIPIVLDLCYYAGIAPSSGFSFSVSGMMIPSSLSLSFLHKTRENAIVQRNEGKVHLVDRLPKLFDTRYWCNSTLVSCALSPV